MREIIRLEASNKLFRNEYKRGREGVFLMMKGLFTNISNTGIFRFLKAQWWIGILTGFFTGLAVFPPNIMNFNNASGYIARTYNQVVQVYVKGKGTVPFPTVFIVLTDSSVFHSSDIKVLEYFLTYPSKNKYVKIKYKERRAGDRSISKLSIDNHVIGDEDKWLVSIFFASIIWRYWRNDKNLEIGITICKNHFTSLRTFECASLSFFLPKR